MSNLNIAASSSTVLALLCLLLHLADVYLPRLIIFLYLQIDIPLWVVHKALRLILLCRVVNEDIQVLLDYFIEVRAPSLEFILSHLFETIVKVPHSYASI